MAKLFFTRPQFRQYAGKDPMHFFVFFSVDDREEWETECTRQHGQDWWGIINQSMVAYNLRTIEYHGSTREKTGHEGVFHVQVPVYDEAGQRTAFNEHILTLPLGAADEGFNDFLKQLRALAPSIKPANIKVAFDADGNHVWDGRGRDIHWEEGAPFKGMLTFDHIGRDNSSVQAVFKDVALGQKRTMFISDFEEIVPLLKCGTLTGTFGYHRKGNRTGCYLIPRKGKR